MFKYLDTMAMKEEKTKSGGNFDGHTTLRRNAMAKHNSSGPVSELQKIRRQNVDSGYSTSDGYDKRWSEELNGANTASSATTLNADSGNGTKWSPTLGGEKNSPVTLNSPQIQSPVNGTPTPNISPIVANNNNQVNIHEYVRSNLSIESSTPKRSASNCSNNNRYVPKKIISIFTNCFIAHLSLLAHYHYHYHYHYLF